MQIATHAERDHADRAPVQIATHPDRDPCRSRLQGLRFCREHHHTSPEGAEFISHMAEALGRDPMRNAIPDRSRPMRIVTHADRDPKAYASVVSTTTPAPKGRNSLAQGVSPGTAPRKEPSPGGATASAPAHKHKLTPIT